MLLLLFLLNQLTNEHQEINLRQRFHDNDFVFLNRKKTSCNYTTRLLLFFYNFSRNNAIFRIEINNVNSFWQG